MWRRASPPWHGTPDWKIGCFAPPPGLPPIRTLDDIQGRARSLLGQEHNPERAVTRIDEPNPAHDHCGELRRPKYHARKAGGGDPQRLQSPQRPIPGAWGVVYEVRIST